MKAMPSLSRFHRVPERYVPPFENGDWMDQKTLYEWRAEVEVVSRSVT
jgi:hypothetical protein